MDSFSATPTLAELKNAVELFNFDASGSNSGVPNLNQALFKFKLANAKVSRGDRTIYAGYFPADKRQGFIWDESFLVYLTLPATNHASDIAAKMVAGGGLNAFTSEKKTVADFEKGLVGWLDGMPLYQVLGDVKEYTWKYMGLNPSDTDDAAIIALLENMCSLISPSNATIRGISPESYKVVDANGVQGVEIQPKVNMGMRTVSGRALKAVFGGEGWTDETTALASIATIRAGIKDRLMLPNMSFDQDPAVQAASVLSTSRGGDQQLNTTRSGIVTQSNTVEEPKGKAQVAVDYNSEQLRAMLKAQLEKEKADKKGTGKVETKVDNKEQSTEQTNSNGNFITTD